MTRKTGMAAIISAGILAGGAGQAWGALDGPTHEPLAQSELLDLVKAGNKQEAFELAFELGDEIFERQFNAFDGVGAKVGQGFRFTRVPRGDLRGPGEWFHHFPRRATGPNAQACNECHRVPADDGAGPIDANVHRDPDQTGVMRNFIQRNTPHVFAPGAIQRLAEEMTEALHAIREGAVSQACRSSVGTTVTRDLVVQGVSFGKISATRKSAPAGTCSIVLNVGNVQGVDHDLVVRPFQWKGIIAFLRDFNRGASHNELGMQAVEIVGRGRDGDFDGVTDEMSVGDQTALAIYLAAQPRPVTKLELNSLGLLDPPLTTGQRNAITRGQQEFVNMKCASCHTPTLKIRKPIFSEPSLNPNYRDRVFTGGCDLDSDPGCAAQLDPLAEGVDPRFPVSFDLTRDQPDNIILNPNGTIRARLGSLRKDASGNALVELFSDLKRHDLGPEVAESIDETGTGRSTFLTEPLWGVGSTAPYMHDGNSTTLTEAIQRHGGEGAAARTAFNSASNARKSDLLDFLNNLVLFKIEEAE